MKITRADILRVLKNPLWFYVIVIALFFYGVACYAIAKSVYAPTYHMDGAFQTASGLFRLLQGELPGRDFYPYLGIGPIALIFPLFLIAGAHLCASVFAAYCMTFAGNVFSIAVLIHLIWKPKSFFLSVVTACALVSIPFFVMMDPSPLFMKYPIPYWLTPMLDPGNSLRPLRGFIVYAAVASLYFIILPEKIKSRKIIYYGMTIAIVSLWSNDYALLTMAALFLLTWIHCIQDSRGNFFKTTGQLILVSIVSVVLVQWLVTGGHPLKLARYNFIDVANDQWWYFGAWSELSRVFSPNEVSKIFPAIQYQYAHYLLASSFAAIFIFKRWRWELLLVFVTGILSLSGGLLACIGGHIMTGYLDGFIFWSKLFILLFGLRLIVGVVLLVSAEKGKWVLGITNVCLCTLLISAHAFYAYHYGASFRTSAKNDARFFYVPEIGGYLGEQWKPYVDYVKTHQENTTVEEYAGLWSALLSKPSIWPVDSAIHALGEVRKTTEKSVREKADIVVTSNRETAALEWMTWNQASNYWFYKILFESYTPAFYSPTTIVWQKNSQPRSKGRRITCKINDSKNRIFLDAPTTGYYEVQLKIATQRLKSNRYLIVFENNMNFTNLERGEISLSPNNVNHTLPVFIHDNENRDFGINVRPAGTVRVSIESCSAREIPFKNEKVLLMSEGIDRIYDKHANNLSFYGDYNFWDRGIATNKAGFFVFKSKKALADFQVGRAVEFPNHEKRVITSVIGGFSAYLEIYVDGGILRADDVGAPTHFKFVSDDNLELLAEEIGERVFITDNILWRNGISLIAPSFIMPNTKQNRELFKTPNMLKIANTSDRSITGTTQQGAYLIVSYDGDLLDSKTVGLPNKFTVIEVEPPTPSKLQPDQSVPTLPTSTRDTDKVNAIKDDFFLTDNTWINGVGVYSAAFFVKNTEENRKLFIVGKRVEIPNTEERKITQVLFNDIYLEVYVTGEVMNGSLVGLPSGFKVIDDE